MKTETMDALFGGLTNLNTGFDSAAISHFSPEEFQTVIERCANQGIVIYGVEVFSVEDGVATLEAVEINPGESDRYTWARLIVQQYMGMSGITLSATYSDLNSDDNLADEDVSLEEALRDFAAEQDRDQ